MNTLPAIRLGGADVSRLIVGGNPFSGYSHFSAEMDREMMDYFTTERIKATLFECERHGITAMLSRGDLRLVLSAPNPASGGRVAHAESSAYALRSGKL